MKLRKEEKISLLQVVDKLIEVGRKFKAISNQEIDEIYEDYLDLLEGGSKGLLEYLEIYKERKSASEKIIRMIEQIREIIGNYFEFIDDEDGDSLEASLELLKDLRKKSEEIEIDIFADLPPPSIKLALTFDDSVKINGLILHLLDLGKKLDEEFDKENDPLRKDNLRNEFLNILKNDTDLIEKEEKLYDRECPVDIKMIHILEETLQVIEGYKSFIEGQQDINTVRGLMDQLKRTSSPLQEILAGHDKELKLLGLVNYLMDTGKKLKIIHKTMDGEEAEGAIEEIYKRLEKDLEKIESERNRYTIHNENDNIGIETLGLCKEVTENYMQALESNDVNYVDQSFDTIIKAAELMSSYQKLQQESREIGMAQYLIKTGKELKSIYLSDLEDREKYFDIMYERLLSERLKLEEKKKKYFDSEKDEKVDPQVLFVMKPVNANMSEIFDKAIEIIDNYIKFIDDDRNLDLISQSFKIAIYIDYMLEESDKMIENMQSNIPRAGTVIGEA